MIEEEHIRFVAAADVTDDCRVEVQMRKPRQALTPSQARELAAEIIQAAGYAERAASELRHDHEPVRFDMVGGRNSLVVEDDIRTGGDEVLVGPDLEEPTSGLPVRDLTHQSDSEIGLRVVGEGVGAVEVADSTASHGSTLSGVNR